MGFILLNLVLLLIALSIFFNEKTKTFIGGGNGDQLYFGNKESKKSVVTHGFDHDGEHPLE